MDFLVNGLMIGGFALIAARLSISVVAPASSLSFSRNTSKIRIVLVRWSALGAKCKISTGSINVGVTLVSNGPKH